MDEEIVVQPTLKTPLQPAALMIQPAPLVVQPALQPALQPTLLPVPLVLDASAQLITVGGLLGISKVNITAAFDIAKLASDSFNAQPHYTPFDIPAPYTAFSNHLALDNNLNSYTVVSDFLFFIITKLYHQHSLQFFHLISTRPTKSLKKLLTSKFLSPPYI